MAQLLIVKTAELANYEAIKWRLVTADEVDQGGELRSETLKIIGDRTLLLAEGATIAPPSPYKVIRNSHVGRQRDVEFALVVTQTTKWGENVYYRGGKPKKNRKNSSDSSDDDDDDDDDDEGGVTALIERGVTALAGGFTAMMGSDESKSDSGAICVGESDSGGGVGADDGTVELGGAGGVTYSHSASHTSSYGDSTSGYTEVASSSHTEVASSSHTEVASSSHTEVASSSHTEVTTSSYSENTTSSYSGGYTSSYSGGGGGGDYSGGGDSGGGGGGGDCGGGDD